MNMGFSNVFIICNGARNIYCLSICECLPLPGEVMMMTGSTLSFSSAEFLEQPEKSNFIQTELV